jgi:malonate transporter and related proteins
MEAVLGVAVPFSGLILAGYLAARLGGLETASVRGLNAFVFRFALPALLLRTVAGAPLHALLDLDLVIAYYAATLVVVLLAVLLGHRLFGGGPGVLALRALGATFGNVGYMGIALVLTAFGPAATLPVVLVLTIDNVLLLSTGVAVLEADRGGGRGTGAVARDIARGLSRNPLTLAIAAGLLLAATGVALPHPLDAFAALLGAAAAPCALFALGATLAAVPLAEVSGEVAFVSALKILAHPALVALATFWLWPLAPTVAGLAVLTAALPTGANVFVLAERYGLQIAPASATVFATHLGSVLTVSLLLAMLAG